MCPPKIGRLISFLPPFNRFSICLGQEFKIKLDFLSSYLSLHDKHANLMRINAGQMKLK